jgi:hypothetical protein
MKVLCNYFRNVSEFIFQNIFQLTTQNFESRRSSFLGTFAEMRKATVSFVKSVCIEQFGSHRMDFHAISYLSIFRKYVDKIQVWLESDKNNWCFMWRPIYICDHTPARRTGMYWLRYIAY